MAVNHVGAVHVVREHWRRLVSRKFVMSVETRWGSGGAFRQKQKRHTATHRCGTKTCFELLLRCEQMSTSICSANLRATEVRHIHLHAWCDVN